MRGLAPGMSSVKRGLKTLSGDGGGLYCSILILLVYCSAKLTPEIFGSNIILRPDLVGMLS